VVSLAAGVGAAIASLPGQAHAVSRPGDFARSASLVQLEQLLVADDGVAGDAFGHSVAIDGDTAVVGAPRDRIGTNSTQGSAYVFLRTGTTWTQQAKLTAGDGGPEHHFGTSVAVDGDTLVVGAPEAVVGADLGRGAAYVFTRSGTVWSQQARLLADDGGAGHGFGAALALQGDTVVVGAPRQALNRGAAYVFSRSAGAWTAQGKLLAGDGAAQHQFGNCVGLSGDTAAVGAYGVEQSRGAVYVFTRTGPAWSLQQRLIAGDRQPGDWLGRSVDIDGDTVVAGADKDSTLTTEDHGSAYVFVRQGTLWTEQSKLVAGDAGPFDGLGSSIGLSGDRVVVGPRPENPPTNRAAYVFARSAAVWTQEQKLTSGSVTPDGFGWAVGIDAGRLIVGAPHNGAGAAHVYAGSNPIPNAPPTITPAGVIEREQGASGAPALIATVSDAEDVAGSLMVAANVPPGIGVSGLANSDGVVGATVVAGCAAPTGPATVNLQVTDSGGLSATAGLTVLVTPNTVRPTLACGADLAVTAAAGGCSAPVAYAVPAPADDCPGSTVACSPPPGSVFAAGVTPVVCTATDAAGNTGGCSFNVTVNPNLQITPQGRDFPASGGTGDVAVVAAVGCAWTAVSHDPWITILSIQAGGLSYEVAANPSDAPRTGTVAIAGLTFTVTQEAAPPARANLAIDLGRDGNMVRQLDPLSYTLTVTNHGPAPSAGTEVVGAVPSGSFSRADATQGTVVPSGNGLRWTIGELAAQATATLTVIVNDPGSGTLAADASVEGALPDPDPSDNATAALWIVNRRPPADLAITRLDAAPSPVVVGRPLTYAVQIVNHGPNVAKDIVLLPLTDASGLPPSGVTVVSTSSIRGGRFTQMVEGPLRYDLAGLPPGEADTVTLILEPTAVTTNPDGMPEPMWPEAYLTTAPRLDPAADPGADPDPDASNNRATVGTVVLPATGADLAIRRFAPSQSPIVGNTAVSYQLEAVNHGPDLASDVRVGFRLPPSPKHPRVLSSTASQGACSPATGDVSCAVGSIPPGGTISVVVAVDTRASRETYDLVGEVDVFVAAREVGLDTDPYRPNNKAEARVTVTPRTGHNLAMASLTASPAVVEVGSPITYVHEVVNLGPGTADDVRLLTLVPSATVVEGGHTVGRSELLFVSASPSQGTCTHLPGTGLSCALEALAAGARATVTVTAAPLASGALTNYALLRNGEGPDDELDPSDNVRGVQTHVIHPPGVDLAIARFDSSFHPFEGGRLTYTIEVVNRGPTPAAGTVLEVRLPPGALRVRATATQGLVETSPGRVMAQLGGLLVGDSATLTVIFAPRGPLPPLAGQAAVRCDFVEINAADNTAVAATP
jgi:uncharacterized repeat protein (TIGR01451 family)